MYKVANDTIIYLDQSEVSNDTLKQILSMTSDLSVKHARVMPDCHYGNGCCIGFTSHLTDYIVPRYIGGDIGCGIATIKIPERIVKKLFKRMETYHDAIISAIPTGSNKRAHPITLNLDYVADSSKAVLGADGLYDNEWQDNFFKRIQMDRKLALLQLGTLGGGNHFIEVGQSQSTGDTYLTVHTGSRALGQAVCRYHQAKAKPVLNGDQLLEY